MQKESRMRATKAVSELQTFNLFDDEEAGRLNYNIEAFVQKPNFRGNPGTVGNMSGAKPAALPPNRTQNFNAPNKNYVPHNLYANQKVPNLNPSSQPLYQSPFHVMLCFSCGMPVDFFHKNPAEAVKENRCQSSFHVMKCHVCSGNVSYCVFKPELLNKNLAEVSGSSGQREPNPDPSNQ